MAVSARGGAVRVGSRTRRVSLPHAARWTTRVPVASREPAISLGILPGVTALTGRWATHMLLLHRCLCFGFAEQ